MVFIPTPDVASVQLRYTQSGQMTENTLYFQRSGAITPTLLEELAEAVFDWWVANLQAVQGAHVTLREVYAVDLTSATSPTATYAETPNPAGSYTGTPLPNNVTLAVSFRTVGRGRSSRGRNYAVGLTETALSSTLGQTVQSTYATALVDGYRALAAAIPAGWSHVIVSFWEDGVARSEGLPIPVTSILITDFTIDSQRRRLPGRGS